MADTLTKKKYAFYRKPQWYEALNTDKDTYDENIHRLGSLTFTARNDSSKMSNKMCIC